MRAWILGVALAGLTGGGVAFVLAGKRDQSHCGPCIEAKGIAPAAGASEPDDGCCPSCKPTRPTDAADVTDLGALLAESADPSRPRLSFDEPAFAPPATVAVRELAPMPRTLAVAEVCPMPRPMSVTEVAPMPRPAK